MSERSSLLANLTPEQLLPLQKRLMRQRLQTPRSVILQRPTLSPCPLSFAQQRLWFLHQLAPHSAFYNVACAFRLYGLLNIAVLQRVLDAIVARHEVLRTTFPAVDLTRDVMLRVMMLRLGPADSILLVVMHHIASDRWSADIFFHELSTLYTAFLHGQESPLPPLPIQYADFAVWQRQWLQDAALDTQLTYWTQQLLGVPAVLELPTDYARPPVQTFRGSRQSLVLPAWLRAALKALSQQESATLFMTLLAAFQTLLPRYTGQEDIVVGTPIANRTRTEIEGLIGFFVNPLVLRTSLADDPSFRELLQRVRKTAMWAYAHQDLPFEKLVEALHPARNLSHSPLLQVFFNLLNFRDEGLILPGLTAQPLEANNSPGAKFDLTFYVHESPDTLTVIANYHTDLFEAATIRRMLTHYQTILEGIVADPEQRLSVLPLLPQVERHRLLMEWNQTLQEPAPVQCVQQLFEAQTARTPDAVAVVYEGEQLTYRELNARANQPAHFLRRQGVAPESLVDLWAERSLGMLVGILGVLKAGGAYVPLDPAYPPGRLAYIMEQANLPIPLTHRRFLDQLPSYTGTVICLDTEHRWWAEEDQTNPDIRTVPEHLAYVIYTSGSTGTPKGVMNHHQGVVNYFAYLLPTYNLDQRDIVLQLPSLSFDASVRDLLGPLLAGAQVVLVPSMEAKNPVALLAKLREHDVTQALPAPDSQHSDYEDTYIAPRTPIEQVLADIWGEVLSINRVGVFDDFFELGGHSLLATRIMARVHNTFQIDLPLRTLFEAPTVAAFAVIVMQHRVLHDNEDVLQGLMADVEGLSETEVQRLLSAQKALAE